ncbi:hypothetical protein P692DRAFT_20422492 [Suillus brevipes Sb2]|nr:hypothetical protein P692DRAFT_20422492 [Suillus brevipes Sb2]
MCIPPTSCSHGDLVFILLPSPSFTPTSLMPTLSSAYMLHICTVIIKERFDFGSDGSQIVLNPELIIIFSISNR